METKLFLLCTKKTSINSKFAELSKHCTKIMYYISNFILVKIISIDSHQKSGKFPAFLKIIDVDLIY